MAIGTSDHAAVELQVRSRFETELAVELARRDLTRVRVEDQDWVHELVSRVVREELRRAAPPMRGEDSQTLLKRIFAAVTPLGPLAEHLADPDVEEIRINGAEACFIFKGGQRYEIPPPFADEAALVDLVHWYTDGTP